MRNSIRSWRACPMWLWGLLVCAKPGNPNPQHAHWWLHTLLGEIKCRKSSFSGFLMIFLEILSNFSRYQQGISPFSVHLTSLKWYRPSRCEWWTLWFCRGTRGTQMESRWSGGKHPLGGSWSWTTCFKNWETPLSREARETGG